MNQNPYGFPAQGYGPPPPAPAPSPQPVEAPQVDDAQVATEYVPNLSLWLAGGLGLTILAFAVHVYENDKEHERLADVIDEYVDEHSKVHSYLNERVANLEGEVDALSGSRTQQFQPAFQPAYAPVFQETLRGMGPTVAAWNPVDSYAPTMVMSGAPTMLLPEPTTRLMTTRLAGTRATPSSRRATRLRTTRPMAR